MKLNGALPTLLFPIETATRELDSKLVMASALAAQGCRAIVGHKEALKEIARNSERLVWQGKSLFSAKSDDHFADRLKERNSAIMFIHDEGGMYQVKAWTHHVLKTHRIEYLRESDVDRICVWGERQKDVLSSYANNLSDIISVTGSPKFDLCIPRFKWVTEQKSEEKRARYSPYILMCTRFGTANHSQGQQDPFQRKMNPALWPKDLGPAGIADLWFSKWHRDVHDFADFILLVKEMATHFPRHKIILRPHPSENISFYTHAFAPFKTVVVAREDSVIPWIRAADLIVHCNCTTGIEAVLAGRPVLNLLPTSEGRTELDVEVAREAGCTAVSIDDAIEKAEQLLAGKAPQYGWSAHALSILHNLTGETIPLLAAETMRVVEEAGITSSKIEMPRSRPLRKAVRRLLKGTATTYAQSKRGPLDSDYVEMMLEGCRSHHVGQGQVRHLTKEYVVIDPS